MPAPADPAAFWTAVAAVREGASPDEAAGGLLERLVPEDHLPHFDRDASAVTYDKWFGQRLLDRDGHAAAFPLGFGLSYTTFTLSDPALGAVDGEAFEASVTVANTGSRTGRHVVQLYGRPGGAVEDFPSRVLLGFASVELPAGASARVTVRGSLRPLLRRIAGGWTPAAATAVIEAASHAGAPDTVTAPSELELS